MRYEVLLVVYSATDADVGLPVRVTGFVRELGVWEPELFRAVEWLVMKGYLEYLSVGPTVTITRKGVLYIEQGARKRRTIRDG